MRASAFGRGFLDLELCFALFALAAGSRSGSTGPSASSARSPSCSRPAGALAAAAPCSSSRAWPGTPRRPRRAALSLALDWIHLAAGSIWLGGLIGLLVLWSQPAGRAAGARARRRRAALLERRVRLGARPARLRASARRSCTCRRSRRSGRRTYGKTMLVKAGLLLGGDRARLGQPAADEAAPRLEQRAVGRELLLRRLVGGEALLVAAAVVRRRAALELPAAREGARARVGGALARVGPGAVDTTVDAERLHAPARGRAEPRRGAERVRAEVTKDGKPVRGADVNVSFCDARHGDGRAGLPADRDHARALRAGGAGARDGRPLGPAVRGHAAGRRAVHRRSSSTGWPDDLAAPAAASLPLPPASPRSSSPSFSSVTRLRSLLCSSSRLAPLAAPAAARATATRRATT